MQKALSLGLHPLLAMAMGVVSAVVGGVIRDILCNEIPLIFRKEIYAMACFIGALVFYLITIALIIGIRIISIKKNLSMPKMK